MAGGRITCCKERKIRVGSDIADEPEAPADTDEHADTEAQGEKKKKGKGRQKGQKLSMDHRFWKTNT
jgi:hypothetical protein